MQVEPLFQAELRELVALESGLIDAFERIGRCVRHRRVAQTLVTLTEQSETHLANLVEICRELGWSPDVSPSPLLEAWQDEVERNFLDAPADPTGELVCLSYLRRAIHLKIPCYCTAQVLAFQTGRPALARVLRLALDDDRAMDQQLANLAELGVHLQKPSETAAA